MSREADELVDYIQSSCVWKRCKIKKKYMSSQAAWVRACRAFREWAELNKDKYDIDPQIFNMEQREPETVDYLPPTPEQESYYYFHATWPIKRPF